jgi:hypothetical protein
VLGNSGNLVALDGPFAGSWAAYAAAFDVASPTLALGAWGYDATTTTAWAVIDHNSQFVVLAVPEPAAALLALLGLGVWLSRAAATHTPPRAGRRGRQARPRSAPVLA